MNIFSVKGDNEEKIVIDKSVFIAIIRRVYNEDEVKEFKKEVMKKYENAKHYVMAYRIIGKEFYDDDGEPSKTSGLPVLKCIIGHNLTNVCIIVVRYFGGVLLGTGGLVKAYTESAKKVITSSDIEEYIMVKKIRITYSYERYSTIRKILEELIRIEFDEKKCIKVIEEKYYEKIEQYMYISNNIYDILEKKIEVENIVCDKEEKIVLEILLEKQYTSIV